MDTTDYTPVLQFISPCQILFSCQCGSEKLVSVGSQKVGKCEQCGQAYRLLHQVKMLKPDPRRTHTADNRQARPL